MLLLTWFLWDHLWSRVWRIRARTVFFIVAGGLVWPTVAMLMISK